MKFLKSKLFTFSFIFFSINVFATDYTDDANKVDFYVPGILANEAASTVNFLLCFVENTNFGTFVDQGTFKALVDEAQCQTASGIDAVSESAAATGTSTNGGGGAAAGNTVDQIAYTPGLYQITRNSDDTLSGKGWVDINIGDDVEPIALQVFLTMKVDEDKSATNKFGTFTMRYDLRTPQITNVNGQALPAGFSFSKGYLSVNGSTINFVESGPFETPRAITADLSVANNQQGFIQSSIQVQPNAGAPSIYSVKHKIQINEGDNQYCQKFDSAQEYVQGAAGLEAGNAITENNLSTLITNTINNNGYVQTDGGTSSTITGEHCWDLRKSEAKRIVYEYGTYKESDESRVDLTIPAMSLEANQTDNGGLNKSIWAHSSYWGTHVHRPDRANVTDTTIFRNKRSSTDTASYSLKKDYLSITKEETQYKALNTLGGVSFQTYVKHFKEETAWATKLANLNFPNVGNCNAADGNCPEYSGVISVNGADVTFTVTHGMDWDNDIPPFKLNSSFSFKANGQAASWATQMTDGTGQATDWNRRMHFRDPDARQSYSVPYAAFVTTNSTTQASQARTRISSEIDIDVLETEMTAAGAANLLCIRECLDPTAVNTAIGELKTAVEASAGPGVLATSPYKDIGDWFEDDVYYDSDLNTTQGVGESTINKGTYNWIGGPKVTDAATYSIATVLGKKYLSDGANELTYATGINQDFVDSLDGGGKVRKYRFNSKPSTYTVNNWTHNYGWAFPMQLVLNTAANRTALLCDEEGGNARGYSANLLHTGTNNPAHEAGSGKYYCSYKLWEGAVNVTYQIRLQQRPDYRLYNNTTANYVSVSAPETVELTVPATNVIYNFDDTFAGQKFKLKFEGFGRIHDIPGRVVDTCTNPPTVLGKYHTGAWSDCYRYVHEFIIPEGTILTNLTTGGGVGNIKVRPLAGDEYLARKPANTTGTYTKEASDLPPETNLQNLFDGANAIGIVPAYSGDPHVIHGVTVINP
jgi:hypothetical protein